MITCINCPEYYDKSRVNTCFECKKSNYSKGRGTLFCEVNQEWKHPSLILNKCMYFEDKWNYSFMEYQSEFEYRDDAHLLETISIIMQDTLSGYSRQSVDKKAIIYDYKVNIREDNLVQLYYIILK